MEPIATKMPKRLIKCPICKKAVDWNQNPYRPFCGRRCSVIDLGKWADDDYKISDPDKNNNN